MPGTDGCNCDSITKVFKNFGSILIHEHDFEPIKIKEDERKLNICLICGLLYCEKCGKLLASTIKNNARSMDNFNLPELLSLLLVVYRFM